MGSELYEDLVGKPTRRWPASYDTCINQACPRCNAQPGDVCTQAVPLRNRPVEKGHPCLVRLALGEGWAHPVDP